MTQITAEKAPLPGIAISHPHVSFQKNLHPFLDPTSLLPTYLFLLPCPSPTKT